MLATAFDSYYYADMFIRRTRIGKTATGEAYFTHRLVCSKREGKKVRQETLLNLGKYFAVPRQEWQLLCSRIDQILSGQKLLFPIECPENVEREAQRIAQQLLIRQGGKETNSGKTPTAAPDSDIQSVDVNSLEMSRPRTVGVENIGLWAMEQTGFIDILKNAELNGAQRAAAIASIIGRMASPGSERLTYSWLQEHSALGELLDVDFEKMSLMQLYRTSDRLLQKRNFIEKRIFEQINEIFSLDCTITLYDLTNTYFEGDARKNPKARRGHSKEKRSDCPLLTLALILDGSGFVRRSEVFAGNVSEARTLESMLQGLNAPQGALVVMDRGIASQANIDWLVEHGFHYLVVSRERKRHFDAANAVCIETASEEKVYAERIVSQDGKEVRLYCYSRQRSKKEEGIAERFCKRFEDGLQKLSDGLSRPRTIKQIDRIHERIGRLKEKSHGIAQHYHVEVIADETGTKAISVKWEKKAQSGSMVTHPGVYALRSNMIDWDEEKLWRTYIMLTDLEAVFRSLKSELGLKPIFHHKQERSEGHLFITVLAYQFVQIIRKRLCEKGIKSRWSTLRMELASQSRVTATFKRADGCTMNIRKATLPDPGLKKIYWALGCPMQPGGMKKMLA